MTDGVETSVPCPFGGNHENDGWHSSSNGTGIHKNGENDFTFHCFKCPDTKRYSEHPKPPNKGGNVLESHVSGESTNLYRDLPIVSLQEKIR